MKLKLILAAVTLAAVFSSQAASLRRFPLVTVAEGETALLEGMNAVGISSANSSIASATPPDGNKSTLSGVRLGETELTYSDERGAFAVRPVRVVPTYWAMLQKFFEDDPEITLGVVGDKVVVAGQTANVDTLRKLDDVRKMDTQRLIVQVTYSAIALSALVSDFLCTAGISNITVTVIGREVCLAGRMFDQQSITRTDQRVRDFLRDFHGISVNSDGLRIYKQKIVLDIELLAYNTVKAKNLGLKPPTSISAELDGTITYDNVLGGGSSSSSSDDDSGSEGGESTTINLPLNVKASATINMLKENQAAKKLYSTQLSTQSGEAALFQSGGTMHKVMDANQNSTTTEEIEYGFIVKATPVIIDRDTVNLDFELDHKTPRNESQQNTDNFDLERYQTKSKYIVRPGETIVLSGFTQNKTSMTKTGWPILSRIPFIGKWIFGNRNSSDDNTEMLLVVTINWALEDETPGAVLRRNELRNRNPISIEMP